MSFGNSVRRAALAFVSYKNLPDSVWHGEELSYQFAFLFWNAFLSVVWLLVALTLLIFRPIFFLELSSLASSITVWLWTLPGAVILFFLSDFYRFIMTVTREQVVRYEELRKCEKTIFWLVSLTTYRWMYLPMFNLVIGRYFSAFLVVSFMAFGAFYLGVI